MAALLLEAELDNIVLSGMDIRTGKLITGEAFVRQAVRLVLQTPTGTMSMSRDFGSRIFELMDKPIDGEFQLKLLGHVTEAIEKWISFLKVKETKAHASDNHAYHIDITYENKLFQDIQTLAGVSFV